MTRTLVGALAAVIALASFAAVAPARTGDVTTVRLVARAQHQASLDALIDRFERQNPNVVVKPTYFASGLNAAVTSTLAAGTAADVLSIGSGGAPTAGIPSVWALAPRYLADLSGRSWVKGVWKQLLPLFSVHGKVYAAPYVNSVISVLYNKDAFARAGVTPPTTWSQFLANCNRLADRGIVPVAEAGADPVTVGFLGVALASGTVYPGDPNWSVERNAGKVSFGGTPGWHRALGLVGEMKDARCFSPSAATTSAVTAYGLFNSGQAAMVIISSVDAVTTVLQPNPSLDVGRFPLPGETPKATRVLVNPAVNLTVNAASPVREQALAFVDFAERAWQSVPVADAENSLPNVDIAAGYAPERWSLFRPYLKARQTYVMPLAWANNPTGVAVFRAGISALLAGTKTVDQVLAEVDAAW
jgi:raffinose/stachyose/melibiose transport system substrate-binding protein